MAIKLDHLIFMTYFQSQSMENPLLVDNVFHKDIWLAAVCAYA